MSTSPSTKLIILMEELRKLGPIVSVQALTTFCVVAAANDENRGVNMKDLEKRLGMLSSSMSRNIQLLGYKHSKVRKEGLDLVQTAPDPDDSRASLVFMTSKGRRLWDKLKTIIEE